MDAVVSIIIPVYKVEQFLDKCVESIVGQTYDALEILLVDDGSPDRCPELCDRWAERDNRVRVIHKPNEGVGKARNTGLEAASGEYIMFVDSDDYLPPDAVEVLVKRMTADGSDMAIGKNLRVYEDGHTDGSLCDFMRDGVLTGDDFLAAMGEKEHYAVAPWGKLYSRRALEGISFPPLIRGQDLWVFPLIVLNCRSVSVVNHLVYNYYQRPTSSVHTNQDRHKIAAARASYHMADIFLQRGQMDCAGKWFGDGIDLLGELEDLRQGVEVTEALFGKAQIRQMRKHTGTAARAKWFLIHHPAAYRGIMGAKRNLTALFGK